MPKLTNQQLQKRKLEMAARSRESIAKKELVQFRLDADKIVMLYEIAANKSMLMGTMLREWVIERMDSEQAAISHPVDHSRVREHGGKRLVNSSPNLVDAVANLTRELSILKARLDKLDDGAGKQRKRKAKTG